MSICVWVCVWEHEVAGWWKLCVHSHVFSCALDLLSEACTDGAEAFSSTDSYHLIPVPPALLNSSGGMHRVVRKYGICIMAWVYTHTHLTAWKLLPPKKLTDGSHSLVWGIVWPVCYSTLLSPTSVTRSKCLFALWDTSTNSQTNDSEDACSDETKHIKPTSIMSRIKVLFWLVHYLRQMKHRESRLCDHTELQRTWA